MKKEKKEHGMLYTAMMIVITVLIIVIAISNGYVIAKLIKLEKETTVSCADIKENDRSIASDSNKLNIKDTTIKEQIETEAKCIEADKKYFEDSLFLGDSRTAAMAGYNLLDENNVFAVPGISHVAYLNTDFTDNITGVTDRIGIIINVRHPKRVYIALGINGVAYIEEDEFIEKYEELIDSVLLNAPDATVIIQSILPISGTHDNENFTNANIDVMNLKLKQLADKKGVKFLDPSEKLKNNYNELNDAYNSGDGIHYNFEGYKVIYDYICKHTF